MDVLEVELVFRGIVRWIRRKKGASTSDGLCALRSVSALSSGSGVKSENSDSDSEPAVQVGEA